ncbi:hypothetical protein LCGC14_1604540 [marine sediment metagenome]|uniref:Uncharacterized protein n=1 Tax=marine sediment metagenome TaxID=412755 RepID=A0A0F9KQX2_9ZZZZ
MILEGNGEEERFYCVACNGWVRDWIVPHVRSHVRELLGAPRRPATLLSVQATNYERKITRKRRNQHHD